MKWIEEILEQFERSPICDYARNGHGASEPTSLAALALMDHDKVKGVEEAGKFLHTLQSNAGHIGMRLNEPRPHWATSLGLLVWKRFDELAYSAEIQKALKWSLSVSGERFERDPDLDHNVGLAAWPWVEGTHSSHGVFVEEFGEINIRPTLPEVQRQERIALHPCLAVFL